jgi:hypothetical protein
VDPKVNPNIRPFKSDCADCVTVATKVKAMEHLPHPAVNSEKDMPMRCHNHADLRRRVEAALDDARDAFWNKLAEAFPEIYYGDLDPGHTFAFDDATKAAAIAWASGNSPSYLTDPEEE